MVWAQCSSHPKNSAKKRRDKERRKTQHDGDRQRLKNDLRHWFVEMERIPQIALKDRCDIAHKLGKNGLIQTVGFADALNNFF